MKKNILYLVITASVLVSIGVSTFFIISIFFDGQNKMIREMFEFERRIRDSLTAEIESINEQRAEINHKIDSISVTISESDQRIKTLLYNFRHDLFQDVRNYNDSSNSAILRRLRPNHK